MDNGAEIFGRWLNGDNGAFDTIIDLYRVNLIYFINGYVHNETDAEDIASDVFCELIVHKNRYSERSSLKTYIYGIARHKALDFLRKKKVRFAFSLDEGFDTEASDDNTEETVDKKEEYIQLYNAIKKLPSEYAEVLDLLYFKELSYAQARTVMKKSEKQMANLLYRAKASLREKLEQK